jgi:glycosyltransferase involved in cell wall biosynthesis
VVRDGVDGFIVPIRDAGAVAERLGELAGRPERLRPLARAARERFGEFTYRRYGERLLSALKGE